jgi:hypothetical protein
MIRASLTGAGKMRALDAGVFCCGLRLALLMKLSTQQWYSTVSQSAVGWNDVTFKFMRCQFLIK